MLHAYYVISFVVQKCIDAYTVYLAYMKNQH